MKDKVKSLNLQAQRLLRKKIAKSYMGGNYEIEMAQAFSTFLFNNEKDWREPLEELRSDLYDVIVLLGSKQGRELVKELGLGFSLEEGSCVLMRLLQLEGFIYNLLDRLTAVMDLFAVINTDMDAGWLENLVTEFQDNLKQAA